jgi:hypothetical protein
VYDDLVVRFGSDSETVLREEVAKALLNKGITLRQLGRSGEELAVYNELIARFGNASETELIGIVSRARANKKKIAQEPSSRMTGPMNS